MGLSDQPERLGKVTEGTGDVVGGGKFNSRAVDRAGLRPVVSKSLVRFDQYFPAEHVPGRAGESKFNVGQRIIAGVLQTAGGGPDAGDRIQRGYRRFRAASAALSSAHPDVQTVVAQVAYHRDNLDNQSNFLADLRDVTAGTALLGGVGGHSRLSGLSTARGQNAQSPHGDRMADTHRGRVERKMYPR